MIKQQHIIINDYHVSTVYNSYDQYTVTCLILVRHNRVRANTTYHYLSGIPYPVHRARLCATVLPGLAYDPELQIRLMREREVDSFYD